IMLTLRKAQQLHFKIWQERRSLGEENQASLELMLVDIESADLVVLNRDWLDWSLDQIFQIRDQGLAHRCVLDQDHVWLVPLCKRNGDTAQLRIFIAATGKIEQVVPFLVDHQPGRAHGPVVLSATLRGRVPTFGSPWSDRSAQEGQPGDSSAAIHA